MEKNTLISKLYEKDIGGKISDFESFNIWRDYVKIITSEF